MVDIIYFGTTFLLIYVIYYFVSIRKAKKDTKKLPAEVKYLTSLYKINLNKINYCSFLNTIALVAALDISIVVVIISKFDDLIWEVLFGIVTLFPIIIISFMLIGKYYQVAQNKIIKEDKSKKVSKKEAKIK